jgi:hypothetical protein
MRSFEQEQLLANTQRGQHTSIPDIIARQHQFQSQDIDMAGMGAVEMQVLHLVDALESGLDDG